MIKRNETIIIVTFLLIIGLLAFSITYASFSQTLNIRGTSLVEPSTWDIHFSSASRGSAGGTITPRLSNKYYPTSTASASVLEFDGTILTWSGTVKSPGDTITFDFFIVNDGDYDATLYDLNKFTLTCKKNGVVETTVCNKLNYVFKYKNGSEVSENDYLNAHSSREVELELELGDFNTDGSDLPDNDVIVDRESLTIQLIYNQNSSVKNQ